MSVVYRNIILNTNTGVALRHNYIERNIIFLGHRRSISNSGIIRVFIINIFSPNTNELYLAKRTSEVQSNDDNN